MAFGFEENYWNIPKPQKPLKLERPDRGFFQHTGETAADLEFTARQHQFLLEMTKFLPDSENEVIRNYSTTQDIKDDFDFFASVTKYDHFQDETMKHSQTVEILPELRSKLNLDVISRSGLPNQIFKRINNRFDSTDKNFNELIQDYASDPSSLTKEDSFLLLGAMLESRTRLYTGMKDLFGDPNDSNDQHRIEAMKNWLESPTLNKDTKRLFFVYLTEFQNVYNRLSTLINPAMSEMPDSTEKTQMTDFRQTLMTQLNAYQTDLQNYLSGNGNLNMSQTDAQTELDTLTALKSAWENPSMDATGWTTQKGAKLLSQNLEDPITNVNEIMQNLTPSQLKGTTNETQELLDENNQRITGKAHDKLWSVYAAGEMRESFDRVVTDSVRVGSTNRNQYNEYIKEMQVYDEKIYEEHEREIEEKKLEKKKEAERKAEAKKAENKAIAASIKANKELNQSVQKSSNEKKKAEQIVGQSVVKQKQNFQKELKKIAEQNHQALKNLDARLASQSGGQARALAKRREQEQLAQSRAEQNKSLQRVQQNTQARNKDQKKAREA
jgi:hypothetical protein